MVEPKLEKKWDEVAEAINSDPMRKIRYAMGLRYLNGFSKNSKILDIGCGEGTGLSMLYSCGFTDLYGVEVSNERINSAKKKLNSNAKIEKINPDSKLPFSNNYFNIVCSFAVIEHTVSPSDFIAEIYRVLKGGGYAIISSDCYTWRILQILKIHRSVQPIDKAMSPIKLIKLFRNHKYKLKHLDTFNLPSSGNLYLWFFKKAIKKFLFKSFEINKRKQNDHIEFLKSRIDYSDLYKFKKILQNYFDDENIYLLQK